MCALLLCESIACLVLMHLLLPVGLSGLVARSTACLTFCGVGESLDLHSLHLVSSLGWVLLGCGLTGTPTTSLHCSCRDIV